MARDNNATIQQHQPLRTPEGWNRQEKMLLVQLDEILDDIYRRFGRLKLSDMGKQMQDGITFVDEETGERKMISEAVSAVNLKVQDNTNSIAEINVTTNRIETKITELGYGNTFMQPDEPENFSKGDIWIQTLAVGTWDGVKTDYDSWQEIKNTVTTWQVVGGIPKVFCWDGNGWVQLYDAVVQMSLQTEIEQLADQIALRATSAELEVLSGQVTEYAAQLVVMAQQIQQTVTAVNAKPNTFVMFSDPTLTNEVHLGDQWIKHDNYVGSWNAIKGHYSSWQEYKDVHDFWSDCLGDRTYIWDGVGWVETSDRATEVINQTKITETATQISLLATQQANLQGQIFETQAEIAISATQIKQYVANNYYGLISGVSIVAAGVEISGSKYIKIKTGGRFLVDSGNFSIDASGNVAMTGTIYATDGTFSGRLSAATGTFAGSLSAVGGTFTGQLSAATGTFAGSLSAAGGTFAGNLSAAGGTFKGALQAATGTFAGQLSAATGTFKGNLTAAGGTFAGELVAATGTFKGALQAATGTFSGNLSAAGGTFKGQLVAASGTFAGSLSAAGGTFKGELVAATGSFKGSLSAATGTFAGNLSAAGGTFAGQLQAATGSFAGSLSAATGTFAGTLSAACVTSGTMSADRIKGGTLALGGNNNTDGVLTIKNANGTQIGSWDRNGINTIAGTIGGWTLASNRLSSGSSSSYVGLDSNASNTYAIWAGAENPANAPTRVTRGGKAYLHSLMIYNPSTQQYEEVDFSRDFSDAVSYSSGSWNGNTFNATLAIFGRNTGKQIALTGTCTAMYAYVESVSQEGTECRGTVQLRMTVGGSQKSAENVQNVLIDAEMAYKAGWNACLAACGISNGGTVYTGNVREFYEGNLDVYFYAVNPYYAHTVSKK